MEKALKHLAQGSNTRDAFWWVATANEATQLRSSTIGNRKIANLHLSLGTWLRTLCQVKKKRNKSWRQVDSNSAPLHYKTIALTTSLPPPASPISFNFQFLESGSSATGTSSWSRRARFSWSASSRSRSVRRPSSSGSGTTTSDSRRRSSECRRRPTTIRWATMTLILS